MTTVSSTNQEHVRDDGRLTETRTSVDTRIDLRGPENTYHCTVRYFYTLRLAVKVTLVERSSDNITARRRMEHCYCSLSFARTLTYIPSLCTAKVTVF